MLLRDLLVKVDIEVEAADMDTVIRGVSYDSRTLSAGELFVAVRGFERDGHQYIEKAFETGAVCVICEEKPNVQIPFIQVADSRKALSSISAAWFGFPSEKLKLIGVTGTNGKTTVTSLLKRVVEQCSGAKAGLIGTNGNMVGDRPLAAELTTPESYQIQSLLAEMVREGCEYAVMEVSSHALHLSRVHGVEFEVGVFTNLTPEHLDFHASMEDYASAKALLFSGSRKSAINIDDEHAHIMAASARGTVLTYAVKDGAADLVAKSVKLLADRVDFCALTIGKINRVELPIPGLFSVYNALSVIAASTLLGFDTDSVSAVLQTCEHVKGRAEVVPTGGGFTVLIDYAHTPDAIEGIITTARGFTQGKVITLFGCGGDRDRQKRPLMGAAAVKYSDFVIVTSDNPRTEEPGAIIDDIMAGIGDTKTPHRVIENRREAIHWALDNAAPGDVLILAGKGHETYQIVGKVKYDFDERDVIAEYFGRRPKTEALDPAPGNGDAAIEGNN